jgi:hypothetical protein
LSFDTRHAERKRILDRIILAAQVVAVLYLATHALIAWRAYATDGILAAAMTFVLLGFGDLYWGARWAYEGDEPRLAAVALAAATLCFASWITRPMFNRWAMRFTADMLDDFGSELKRMQNEAEEVGTDGAGEGLGANSEDDSGKSTDGNNGGATGGGARPLE